MSNDLPATARAALANPPDGAYLNNAAEGLLLASAAPAWERYARAKSLGARGRDEFAHIEHDARESFASVVGANSADVAFVASTSRGLDIAVHGIDWKPGDVLVTLDTEFPSTLFSAELLRRRGVSVTAVAAHEGAIREDDVVAAIDEHTRLVVVSLVSFKTGQHLDTAAISARAREVGAIVFADAVQAVGSVKVSVEHVDVLCAATFKWMLGIHGTAGFYVSERARDLLRPSYAGYRSVSELFPRETSAFEFHTDTRRYEEGMPAFAAQSVLVSSLATLKGWGIQNIQDHNRRAVSRLRSGLRKIGAALLLPDDSIATGGIVAFGTPRFADIASELERHGTTVWARDGRVRLAAHAYTRDSDVDAALAQLEEIGVAP